MYPHLAHIYGSLYINSYGAMIACALLLFIRLVLRDSRCKMLMTTDQVLNGVWVSAISGIIGGRLLWAASSWHELTSWWELIELWRGGLSVLGAFMVVIPVLVIYLRSSSLPVLPVLDIASTYAGVLQGVSRIGCFLAGCCYGKNTIVPWAVMYTHPEVSAPLGVSLHPTQLYSALIFCGIFIGMTMVVRKRFVMPGAATCIYLFLSSAERFIVDFIRGDREFMMNISTLLSLNQLIALGIMVIASVGFIGIHMKFYKNTVMRIS